MTRIPFLLILLTFCSLAQAADWQLDILVFERDASAAFDPDKSGRFHALDWPEMLALDNDAGVPLQRLPQAKQQAADNQGVSILPNSSSSLRSAVRRLNSTGRYQVLTQHSIRIRQNTTTPPMRLQDGVRVRLLPHEQRQPQYDSARYWQSTPDLAPAVDTQTLYGWFRLSHQRHPIVSMDISYLRPAPGVFPLQTTPDGVREYYRDQVSQFRLKAQRKLRDGKMAYFDHPRLGVLARLTKLSQSD